MPDTTSRFVAIANAIYTGLPPLPHAVQDAESLSELLQEGFQFEGVVLPDLERGALLDAVDEHLAAGSASDRDLVVLWTSHAEIGVDGTLRLMGRSAARDTEVAAAGQLGEWAARTGSRQVLVLIDTCYSGQGLIEAAKLADAVNSGRAAPGSAWFGIVAASLSDEPARAGVLARELRRLLTDGPRKKDFRWDKSRPYIRADDLVQALLDDWSEPRHTPSQISLGKAWNLVRNPLHVAGIPDQPVEHLLLAARSSSGGESFFTGREGQLADIVAWMGGRAPGLCLVTGPPGSGKSAVVGRIVSLSSPQERARLVMGGTQLRPEIDPGESSVQAQLHARGVTVDTASEELARQLGVDASVGVFAVLAEARRRRKAGEPLVVAIDGLDEARGFSRDLALELVQPLAREALVLVSTREVSIGDSTLIALLGPVARPVNLGQDVDGTRRDVHDYVRARLTGVSADMNAEKVADALSQEAGEPSAAPFLLARLVTSQLRDKPVDTSSDGWQMALSASVESALERDLQSVVLDVGGSPDPTAAREMLRALACAYGSGFPADDVWPAVATALSSSGSVYDRNHAYRVLEAMGRHLIAGSEGDQPVYRIAHQRLVDYLATDLAGGPMTPTQQGTKKTISNALFELYDELLESGLKPRDHSYLWRYAWLHLAEGGESGIEHLRRLVERDREAFLPDLAMGLGLAASMAWSSGEVDEATVLIEQEIAIRRELGDLLRLAMALSQLAVVRTNAGDEAGAEMAAAEASTIAMEVRDRPDGLAVLSSALLTRGLTQLQEGRYKEAKILADEVIELLEHSVDGGELDAWQQLAAAHGLAGEAAIGMQDLEAAASHCQHAIDQLDAQDESVERLESLAEVLSSLAVVQFLEAGASQPDETGTYRPAIATAGERLLRERKRDLGPLYDVAASRGLLLFVRTRLLDRLRGLEADDTSSLAAILEEVIERMEPHADQMAHAAIILSDALLIRAMLRGEPDPSGAEEDDARAIRLLRRFAAQSTLASIQLGVLLDAQNQRYLPEMLASPVDDVPTLIERQQEAVALLRKGTAPIHRTSLGEALGRLAFFLKLGGGVDLDVAAGAEAVDVWRSLVGVFPYALPQLVACLVDQVERLGAQRASEALDLAREAVDLAARLPQTQFSALVGLANLNLAASRLRMGVAQGIRELLEKAIICLEPLTPHPVLSNGLATAYLNLANVELEGGSPEEALSLAEKALEIYRASPAAPTLLSNEPLARLALGRAQRACGQVDLGTATLQGIIEELRTDVVAGRTEPELLAAALNTAPEMWEPALEALRDQPEIVWRLELLRKRPRRELHMTVQVLLDALARSEPKRMRTVREAARFQRSVDPQAFDKAWLDAAGEIPPWLTVDLSLEWTVIAWWNTPNWELSRDYLRAHPALLSQESDILLEEFRAESEQDLLNLHLTLLAGAREEGVAAAYAPLLIRLETDAWIESEDPKGYLAEHPDLLQPGVVELLAERASEGSAEAAQFGAVLDLAQRNEGDLAFKALEDPEAAVGYLQPAWQSKDSARLAALATIIFHGVNAEDATKRTAAVAQMIAAVLQGDREDPGPFLAEALAGATSDERGHLATLIGDAVAHHPAAAAALAGLVPLVGVPPPGNGDSDDGSPT